MVLQQTHSLHHDAQATRLDVNRILGISSTLALNVLALALLLAPMTLPPAPVKVEPTKGIEVVPIVPIERQTPPPDVVPVTPPQVQPQPRPVLRDAVAPPAADAPVLVDQGIFIDTASDTAVGAGDVASIEPPGPVVGMQLQYAVAPAPTYPRAAIQRELEGTVLLRILVDVDGRPLAVSIEKSSGHAVLDREALRHVQRSWTFRPALRDGQPVQAVGIVPIDFRLDRG